MVLAKQNLDPPPPVPGYSSLLHRSVSQQGNFLMLSCPDFTDVVLHFGQLPHPDQIAWPVH